jgi:hypothetical protein
LSPLKERKERKKQKRRTYLPFFEFFLRFSENIFMAFLGSSCRETAKNAIKQVDGKRRQEKGFFFSQTFSAKSF